jgi:hypothetical protein
MKQLTIIFFLIFVVVFLTNCDIKKEDRNSQFFTSLTIKIPYELIDNIETVDFLKRAESSINEYSDNIEIMVFNGKDIILQDPNIMSELDKRKLDLMTVQFISSTTQMDNVLEETQKYIENAKMNGFDESKLKSLEIIKDTLKNRVIAINKKYKKYFN